MGIGFKSDFRQGWGARLTVISIAVAITVSCGAYRSDDLSESDQNGQCIIDGTILDSDTGEPIVSAAIWIDATNQRALTDINGHFHLELAGQGIYAIRLTHISHEQSDIRDFAVSRDSVTVVRWLMDPDNWSNVHTHSNWKNCRTEIGINRGEDVIRDKVVRPHQIVGTVAEYYSHEAIRGVKVYVVGGNAMDTTDWRGQYATNRVYWDEYRAIFSHPDYQTVEISDTGCGEDSLIRRDIFMFERPIPECSTYYRLSGCPVLDFSSAFRNEADGFEMPGRLQLRDYRVRGQVTDSLGAAIAGASVCAIGTPSASVTDADGNYELELTAYGYCKLLFFSPGYMTLEYENLELDPGSVTVLDVILPHLIGIPEDQIEAFEEKRRLGCEGTDMSLEPEPDPTAVEPAEDTLISVWFNAPRFLGPNQLKDTANLGAGQPRDCSDSAQATHPSLILADERQFGHKYWMAYSPVTSCRGAGDENPRVVCSDDGFNWSCDVAPGKFIHNPLFTPVNISASINHLSDPDLFWIDSTTMGLVFRARFGVSPIDSMALYLSRSEDGVEWSRPTIVLVDREVDAGEPALMSPAIVKGDRGDYIMFAVEGRTDIGKTNVIYRYESVQPDSAWSFTDSIIVPRVKNGFSKNYQSVWHLELIPWTEQDLIGLFTMCDVGSFGQRGTLYLGFSPDYGKTWDIGSKPLLLPVANSWDSDAIYRSSGFISHGSSGDTLHIYYSALHGPSKTWHIGITSLLLKAAD